MSELEASTETQTAAATGADNDDDNQQPEQPIVKYSARREGLVPMVEKGDEHATH